MAVGSSGDDETLLIPWLPVALAEGSDCGHRFTFAHVIACMSSLTLAVDEDLKERMDDHPEINWSHVARQSIESKLDDLELMNRLADGIDLSEEDIDEIAAEINRRATERAMDDLAERDQERNADSESERERAGAQ
jgi:hypothetical protein